MRAKPHRAGNPVLNAAGKIAWALAGVLVTGFFTLGVLWAFSDESDQPNVVITLSGSTNSPDGRFCALLTVSNAGSHTIRRQPFCTTYWTNGEGVFSVDIVPLFPTNRVIKPGRFETVAVTSPPEPVAWRPDFSFNLEPGIWHRIETNGVSLIPWFRGRKMASIYDQETVCSGPVIAAAPDQKAAPAGRSQP